MFNLAAKRYSDSSKNFVRKMFLDYSSSMNFIHNITVTSLEAFDHWIDDRLQYTFEDFFVITNNGEDIGIVYSYERDTLAQHIKVTIALDPEKCGMGLGAAVIINYLEKLFKESALNKVFAEIYSFNKESLESTLKFGFKEEGVLRNYKVVGGEYCDLHILSLDRDEFYSIIKGDIYEKLRQLCGSLFK